MDMVLIRPMDREVHKNILIFMGNVKFPEMNAIAAEQQVREWQKCCVALQDVVEQCQPVETVDVPAQEVPAKE